MRRVLAALLLVAALPGGALAKAFPDVAKGYWARAQIETMAGRGIIQGYPDGSFRPAAPVTAQEMGVLVCRAFKQKPVAGQKPVPEGTAAWAEGCMEWLYDVGWLPADGPDRADRPAPRGWVMAILARASGVEEKCRCPDAAELFKDGGKIRPGWLAAIGAMRAYGLAYGYPDGTLRPQSAVTRAEAAALLWRVMELITKEGSG